MNLLALDNTSRYIEVHQAKPDAKYICDVQIEYESIGLFLAGLKGCWLFVDYFVDRCSYSRDVGQ